MQRRSRANLKITENTRQSLAVDLISIFTKVATKFASDQGLIAGKEIWKPKVTKEREKQPKNSRFCLVLVCLENKSAILKFSREKPAVHFFVTSFNPTRLSMMTNS